jgi:hypothetical protein
MRSLAELIGMAGGLGCSNENSQTPKRESDGLNQGLDSLQFVLARFDSAQSTPATPLAMSYALPAPFHCVAPWAARGQFTMPVISVLGSASALIARSWQLKKKLLTQLAIGFGSRSSALRASDEGLAPHGKQHRRDPTACLGM